MNEFLRKLQKLRAGHLIERRKQPEWFYLGLKEAAQYSEALTELTKATPSPELASVRNHCTSEKFYGATIVPVQIATHIKFA